MDNWEKEVHVPFRLALRISHEFKVLPEEIDYDPYLGKLAVYSKYVDEIADFVDEILTDEKKMK